jgi:hypothetical protein
VAPGAVTVTEAASYSASSLQQGAEPSALREAMSMISAFPMTDDGYHGTATAGSTMKKPHLSLGLL